MLVGRLIAAAAMALVVLANAASSQVPEGRIYMLHSKAVGGCPSLDWHIVVEANDILAGLIAWNDMNTISRATGRVDRQNHTFSMTAVEMGAPARKATVDGQIGDNGTITANIKGPNVTCNSVIVRAYDVSTNSR